MVTNLIIVPRSTDLTIRKLFGIGRQRRIRAERDTIVFVGCDLKAWLWR